MILVSKAHHVISQYLQHFLFRDLFHLVMKREITGDRPFADQERAEPDQHETPLPEKQPIDDKTQV